MTDKWFDQEPWPERLRDGFNKMSREHRREFMDQSWDEHLRQHYENSLRLMGHTGPDWSEITPDQKKNIENTVKEHAQALHTFGVAVASGDADEMDVATRGLLGR